MPDLTVSQLRTILQKAEDHGQGNLPVVVGQDEIPDYLTAIDDTSSVLTSNIGPGEVTFALWFSKHSTVYENRDE